MDKHVAQGATGNCIARKADGFHCTSPPLEGERYCGNHLRLPPGIQTLLEEAVKQHEDSVLALSELSRKAASHEDCSQVVISALSRIEKTQQETIVWLNRLMNVSEASKAESEERSRFGEVGIPIGLGVAANLLNVYA